MDKCIDTFFNAVANNFARAMIEADKKYVHVNVRNIPIRAEALSFYGVTFYVDSKGVVDQYNFTYDKYIHRYFYRSRQEAEHMLVAITSTPFYNDPDFIPEKNWIEQVGPDLFMLCFDKSHFGNISLNPDYYTVEIIR